MQMPPQKKLKSTIAEEDASAPVAALRQKAQDIVGNLGQTLDQLEESEPKESMPLLTDASMCFMQMKSLQRQVLDQIHQSQKTLDDQRKKRDEQELQLQNLKYQKELNDHAISSSQGIETSQLVELCRSELDEESSAMETDKHSDSRTVVERFFQVDAKDPVQRAVIVDKLNQQIRARKKLEAELERCQHQAAALKSSLASKRKLLQSLPNKLQEMERASLPLQKFCQKSLNATKLTGTQRRTNLDLAHALPKALYTLFYLLQSSLDSMETSGEMATLEETMAAPALKVDKDAAQVILEIPIPHISDRTPASSTVTAGFGNSKKVVSITFQYDEKSNVVTAASSQDHDMGNLLVEVFPRDTGEPTVETAADSSAEVCTQDIGRPFNWCNYLAGLYLAPSERVNQLSMHKSATVVVRALLRRVRAQATLGWILHAFSRKPHPIPVHPALKDASFCQSKDSPVKLVSWTEDAHSDGATKAFYLATLKQRAVTLSLRVGIHRSRYPSIPPTWEFNPERSAADESLDEEHSTLYDEQLCDLERRINQNVEQLVISTDDTTYEWILSHQLSEIAAKWEQQLQESESTS